jgi:type IV secretion system protein VirB2
LVALALLAMFAPDVLAGGTNLPYVSAMQKLQDSLSGPWALSLTVVGIVAAGGALILGGDLNGFVRAMIMIVGVGAMILGATSIISGLGFNSQGATIGEPAAIVGHAEAGK